MGLLIRQGVQKEKTYMSQKNALLKIVKLAANPKKPGVGMIVTVQILNGENKGEFVDDYVDYDPNSKVAWRYRDLRKAAKVPYSKDEGEEIDIERLLLNKVVIADLAPREYEVSGQTRQAQNIAYITEEVEIEEDLELSDMEDFEEDLPEVTDPLIGEEVILNPKKNTDEVPATKDVKPKDDEEDWPF